MPSMSPTHQTQVWRSLSWMVFWIVLSLLSTSYRHVLGWVFYLYISLCLLKLWKHAKGSFMSFQYGRYQAELRARQETPSGNHGEATYATYEQKKAAGLYDPHNGVLFGVDEHGPLFFSYTHNLSLAPAGSGKSTGIAIPAKTHGYRVEKGRNVSEAASCVVTDLKGELAAMTARLSAELHGHIVIFLNPDNLFGLLNTAFNPLQIIIEELALDDPSGKTKTNAKALCEEIILVLLPDPKEQDKNVFFRNGSRKILIVVILYLAAAKPSHCHLIEVFCILSSIKTLASFLEEAQSCTALSGEIGLLASDLLSYADEYLPDFLAGATQAVQCFGPSSPLANSVTHSEFTFDDLKKKRISVYIMARFDRQKAYAPWIGLVTKVAIKSLIRTEGNIPVHFLLDEATNIPLHGLAEDLTALRGYGLRAQIICQGKSELRRVFGKDSTETIYSQTDMKQFFGVTSLEEAREISAMIGNVTVKAESLGADRTSPWTDLKDSVSENFKPLIRPEELLNLDRDEQIVFIKGLPTIRCKRLPYNHVSPMHDWLDPNPLEGGKLPADPKVYLSYQEVN